MDLYSESPSCQFAHVAGSQHDLLLSVSNYLSKRRKLVVVFENHAEVGRLVAEVKICELARYQSVVVPASLPCLESVLGYSIDSSRGKLGSKVVVQTFVTSRSNIVWL